VIGQNIDFAQSPLSTKSIVGIFEHLSESVTGNTLTLKQTAVDDMVFPFTSEQSGITYYSWDELVETKANWTISLV
jgi:hypothetical protein